MAKIFQREVIFKVLKGSEPNLTLEQLKNQRKGAKLFLVSFNKIFLGVIEFNVLGFGIEWCVRGVNED